MLLGYFLVTVTFGYKVTKVNHKSIALYLKLNQNKMKKFENKNVIITGGTSGIGLATAEAFLKEGARVWITGRNQDTLIHLQKQINNDRLNIVHSDTSSLLGIASLSELISSLDINIDVLFVNAGVAKFQPLAIATEEDFDNQFNTNVKGAYFTMQKMLPFLKSGASIIINASTNATASALGSSIYAATKAAVIKIAKVAANELASQKIRVNIVSPGPTLTRGLEGAVPNEALDYLASLTAVQRLGVPSEIANAVLFLSSDEASFITGTELVVDGGLLNYAQK